MERSPRNLSRRERQIVDAVYALGEAGASEVVSQLGDSSLHDSVRVTLGILEKKGYLAHRQEGNRNIYYPVVPAEEARGPAMQHLTKTFFGGSPSRAILAFLDHAGPRLTEDELAEISRWIEQQAEEQ